MSSVLQIMRSREWFFGHDSLCNGWNLILNIYNISYKWHQNKLKQYYLIYTKATLLCQWVFILNVNVWSWIRINSHFDVGRPEWCPKALRTYVRPSPGHSEVLFPDSCHNIFQFDLLDFPPAHNVMWFVLLRLDPIPPICKEKFMQFVIFFSLHALWSLHV